MDKRSHVPTTPSEADALDLREMYGLIADFEHRVRMKKSASLRKLTFKRLCWLEEQRERVHGVPAPKRKF